MTTAIKSDASGTFGALQVGGADVLRFGADNSGALTGFRNILINGEVTRINTRGIVNWAAVANGAYGYDRWKKIDASNMTQIVEAGNFIPNATYTLSGVGVTKQQLTAPASGHWTLPNIPITATHVQCECGFIDTPFETRLGLDEFFAKRYLPNFSGTGIIGFGQCISTTLALIGLPYQVPPRVTPTGISFTGTFSVLTSGGVSQALSGIVFDGSTSGSVLVVKPTASAATLASGNNTALLAASGVLLGLGCEL